MLHIFTDLKAVYYVCMCIYVTAECSKIYSGFSPTRHFIIHWRNV